MRSNKKGFTLIELLIVIAILGALAVGLLASIDPLEQVKKGRDTAARTAASQFYNAILAYYGDNGVMPGTLTNLITAIPATDAGITNVIATLETVGLLKQNFVANVGNDNLKKVYVNVKGAATDRINVCVNPESKTFRGDQAAKYNISAVTQATSACPIRTNPICAMCF